MLIPHGFTSVARLSINFVYSLLPTIFTMSEIPENELSQESALNAKTILIIDDDPEIVESVRIALQSEGYNVFFARDGNQGLTLAERENPDLIILDMMMPKRSGFLVLEKLRRTRRVPVRIIMVTANEGNRHKTYAETLGVDDYIRKPFAMDRLLDSVNRLLERNTEEQNSQE